ncbi:MAG TPA: hypothetical protein VFM18_02645 [Methanosarcina sp.]|nr:hypothetical protein [Methanosarcina sp.]
MNCPYQKPSYLTETEQSNCYATNRGWVILKPNGKYDIVQAINGLDDKIAEWHKVNDVEREPQPVKEEHTKAHANLKKTVVQEKLEQLAEVKEKIKKVKKEIEVAEKELPVVDEVASEATDEVTEEKQEATDSESGE